MPAGFFLAWNTSAPNAGNKKAEPKPRFLDDEICRRFIRGRQIDRQWLSIATMRREYDSCFQRLISASSALDPALVA
ncbi:hypothetical protein, partial [Mesorhizobium sp. M7A.F.Ca.AU.002.02.1.1]|uniref:hypothetical protein n=1 Tax=Mesorhizobium sp. M7A.F.Ca.AU.002.02.1.1 TaxID=2496671 RepID=UPI0019CFBB14